MRFFRNIRNLLLITLVIAGVLGAAHYAHMWPLRFQNELDAYFGEGKWEWVSSEDTEEYRHDIYWRVPNNPTQCSPGAGKHHSWYIAFEDPTGQKWMWRMTDHIYYVTMHHRGAFSGFSARDGITAELMDLSFRRGCCLLSRKTLGQVLSQEELNCLRIEVSYRGGNPGHPLYEKMRQQPWFDSGHLKEYLSWDYHDFYLNIYPYNHRTDRLSPELQAHLLSSLPQVEAALQQALGEEHCDYKVHLGQDAQGNPIRAEYPAK